MLRTLAAKLIIAVGCILVVSMGLLAYAIIGTHREQLIGEVIRGAARFCDTIKRSTRMDMLEFRNDRVFKTIETIGQQEGIERVRIFNKEGKIIHSTDASEIGLLVDKKTEACYACHAAERPLERLSTPDRYRIFKKEGHRLLSMIAPIYNEPVCYQALCHFHPSEQKVLGVLDIGMSLRLVDEEIVQNSTRMLIYSILAILGTSFIIALFIRHFVHRPVRMLVDGTKRVAEGDLDHEIAARSNNEIGDLAQSFNQMTRHLRDTQSQLVQSAKMVSLGKLAAGVAHEINNPLTSVLTFSHLMLEDTVQDDAWHDELETIVRETMRCRDIVRGLLDFARQAIPQKKPVFLNSLIEATLILVEKQIAFQNIKVNRELASGLPEVMVDTNQIQQVFMNILLNAADSMPGRGTITVRTRLSSDGKYVEVEFEDTGCGIPPADLERLFEPFFSTKEGKGTGLGLAVSYGIVKSHGGAIDVKSKVGTGSVFTMKIPIEATIGASF